MEALQIETLMHFSSRRRKRLGGMVEGRHRSGGHGRCRLPGIHPGWQLLEQIERETQVRQKEPIIRCVQFDYPG